MLLTSSAFETMKNELENRDRQIIALAEENSGLATDLAVALKRILERDQQIAKLETDLAERDERIAELKAEKDRFATEEEIKRAEALRGAEAAIMSIEEIEEAIAIAQASHERAMSEMEKIRR